MFHYSLRNLICNVIFSGYQDNWRISHHLRVTTLIYTSKTKVDLTESTKHQVLKNTTKQTSHRGRQSRRSTEETKELHGAEENRTTKYIKREQKRAGQNNEE